MSLSSAALLLATAVTVDAQQTGSTSPLRDVVLAPRDSVSETLGIAAEPLALLGVGGDVEDEFDVGSAYLTALRAPGGEWLVLDGYRLHVFAADGRHHRSFGREGDGPGEYRAMASACVSTEGTIAVYDARHRRISRHSASGEFLGSINASEVGVLQQGACTHSGEMVLARTVLDAASFGVQVSLISQSGDVKFRLPNFSLGPMAPAARPRPSVILSGDRLVVAPADRDELHEFSVDGQPTRTVRWRGTPSKIGGAEWNRLVEESLPVNYAGEALRRARERLQAMPRREHWPAYGRLFADRAGSVWVEDFRRSAAEPSVWTRYNANWEVTGRVRIEGSSTAARREVVGFGEGTVAISVRSESEPTRIEVRALVERERP